MADFFFFTDINHLNNQLQTNSYGPINSLEAIQYRVTSIHSASTTPNAYAICDGTVFVQQDQTNANAVNLILKPIKQSVIEYATIKYIIYRGIDINSLFNGSEIASRTNNNLTESIWASQDLFNSSNNTNDTPSSSCLGINLSNSAGLPNQLLDTENLENAFSKYNNTFQFPMVKGGWSLGKFLNNAFGLEIILSGHAYDPSMNIVRKFENIIQVNPLGSSPSQVDNFNYLNSKQQILNYIDPCAFYGLFYHEGVKVKFNSSDTSFTKIKGDLVYSNILDKFSTKGLIYLDIRNEHNYPLNYYQNYNAGINLSIDNGSVNNYQYHDGNDWPIFVIQNTLFPGSGATAKLKINLPKGDNDIAFLYLGQGFYSKKYPRNKEKLTKIEFNNTNTYTNDIELVFPRHNSGQIISNYLNIRYLKGIASSPNFPSPYSQLTLFAEHFIDNIFDLKILLNQNGDPKIPENFLKTTKWRVTDEIVFVDQTSGNEKPFMAKVGVAEDLSSIYFFCVIDGEDLKNGTIDLPIVTGESDSNNFITEVIGPQFENYSIFKKNIDISPSVFVNALTDSQPNEVYTSSKIIPSADKFIIVAIDKINDFPLLKNSFLQFPSEYSKRLVIGNLIPMTDLNGLQYQEGKLNILGHNTSTNNMITYSIDTTIKFYKQDE